MHTTARLALVLLTAVAVPVAGTAQRHDPLDDLNAFYDPARRHTRVGVTVKSVASTSSSPTLDLQFFTSHPDSLPSRPMDQFQLVVLANVRQPEPPRFTGVSEATFLVDDSVEIRLEGEHRPRTGSEVVTFQVSHSQALRLGAARSVQARIGPWEFRLAPEEIARVGRLLAFARLDPAAPVPIRWTLAPPGASGTYRIVP